MQLLRLPPCSIHLRTLQCLWIHLLSHSIRSFFFWICFQALCNINSPYLFDLLIIYHWCFSRAYKDSSIDTALSWFSYTTLSGVFFSLSWYHPLCDKPMRNHSWDHVIFTLTHLLQTYFYFYSKIRVKQACLAFFFFFCNLFYYTHAMEMTLCGRNITLFLDKQCFSTVIHFLIFCNVGDSCKTFLMFSWDNLKVIWKWLFHYCWDPT